MSFNPLSVPSQNYIGSPYRQPVKTEIQAGDTPAMVPITINWLSYGVSQSSPNAAVSVSLTASNQPKLLSCIRGVYIDNTQSDGSIYVYFPDTTVTVTCAPFSTAWSPVLTNGTDCTVIGKGFGTGDLSQTKVFLFNTSVAPGTDTELNFDYPQWLASPQNAGLVGSPNRYGSPALGDQWQFVQAVAVNGVVGLPLFGTPFALGGVITLTDFTIGYNNNTNSVGANPAVALQIISTGASGLYFEVDVFENANLLSGVPKIIASKTGMQQKLEAAESWVFRITANAATFGKFSCHVGYNYQGPQTNTQGYLGTLNLKPVNATLLFSSLPYGGFSFLAPTTGAVLDATIAVNGSPGFQPSGTYHLELWTDVAGSPGAKVGASSLSIAPTAPLNAIQFNTWIFNQPPAMTAGSRYWIVMVPDSLAPGVCAMAVQYTSPVAGFLSGTSNTTITALSNNLANATWQVNIHWQSS